LAENRPDNWECINDIHLDIRDRQNKVTPLLPLVSSKGYKARFDFVEIGPMERDSREKAAQYLYDQATNLIARAEKGDKIAARSAFAKLNELSRRYYKDYRDKTELLAQAKRLGTSYVLIDIKNQSNKILPEGFAERLLAMGKRDLDTEWKQFFFESRPGEQFDYTAVFKITSIDISPERVNERSYNDEKRIQDGWEYELDNRGNVKKDSLGNDIKHPKYVYIQAQVLEVHQTKAARLSGYFEIHDTYRKTLLDSRNMSTEILFEHFAATFRGDERALSQDSRVRIGNRPVPFPLDADMLVQAAERLKPDIQGELRSNRAIL
jgi:hypothetical protein